MLHIEFLGISSRVGAFAVVGIFLSLFIIFVIIPGFIGIFGKKNRNSTT